MAPAREARGVGGAGGRWGEGASRVSAGIAVGRAGPRRVDCSPAAPWDGPSLDGERRIQHSRDLASPYQRRGLPNLGPRSAGQSRARQGRRRRSSRQRRPPNHPNRQTSRNNRPARPVPHRALSAAAGAARRPAPAWPAQSFRHARPASPKSSRLAPRRTRQERATYCTPGNHRSNRSTTGQPRRPPPPAASASLPSRRCGRQRGPAGAAARPAAVRRAGRHPPCLPAGSGAASADRSWARAQPAGGRLPPSLGASAKIK